MLEDESERLRRERDLYRQLLDLGHQEEIDPFLEEALTLIVKVTGARRGYLELQEDRTGGGALFWIARGCSQEEVTEIRESFSRGVIAEALATGRTIVTASALLDPRFKDRGSVRRNRIEAVLCAPIGQTPPLGVLYLQDREVPGPFTDDDRALAEIFARTVAVLADRLLLKRRRRDEEDPTLPHRKALQTTDGLVGRSAALAHLLKQVSVAARRDVGVLLTGPSGTGKTRVAKLVHDNSPRQARPFVELNCATLTAPLFESELFGAAQGAHSTAAKRVEGKVAAAEGGTLFLDEVGEIPLASQAKLLQLLESKEYYPLGSARPIRADVRFVAATNADLKAAVKQHTFREDLYYRLEVMPIRVPALAERPEDIHALVQHFCALTVEGHGLPRITPSEGALRAAMATEWPGNIRQLANVVQRAVFAAADEGVLQVERWHLFPDDGGPSRPGDGADGKPAPGAALTFQQATRAFQRELLQKVLDEMGWSATDTAARLDLTRSHVYNLIKAFALARRR